jgi:hypothetical protein
LHHRFIDGHRLVKKAGRVIEIALLVRSAITRSR